MKLATLALYSILGVSAAASAGYMLAPDPAQDKPAVARDATTTPLSTSTTATGALDAPSTFTAGTTLHVEGRLGNAVLPQGAFSKTFLLLDVRPGQTTATAKPVEGHLAIVIDRSGSMKGDRLPKALSAAKAAVDKLSFGDRVSVISFDTTIRTDVPMVEVTVSNRQQIKDAIDAIQLGGDTCISCGISAALAELGQSTGFADRMILLSDGEPTAGVRDEGGFFPVAKTARDASVGITTIGVGTAYNHKIMGAIALGSGGNHYFVEDPSSLEKAFLVEADKLKTTVALGATATITLAEGVELERVYDRSFEREGKNRIKVQLGNFSAGDTRTVLVELKVPTNAEGVVPVADVSLAYDDRVLGGAGRCEGKLAALVKGDVDAPSETDPQVATRMARSKTAATLLEVNELIEQGRTEEAEAKIKEQQQELSAAAEKAKRSAGPGKSAVVGDLAGQSTTLSNAREGLDAKKGGAKPRAVRKNVEMMNPYML